MRIAVCLSGQPRTWQKCYRSWQNLFSRFDAEVDYYYHLWDFNSLPQILNEEKIESVTEQELTDIQGLLNPKKFLIEGYDKSVKVRNDLWDQGQQYPLSGGTPVHWSASQFYSLMRCAHLKREYELENHIQYDVCFKMRTDLYFGTFAIENFINEFVDPRPNTIYSCHNGWAESFPHFRIGDIFYYSDSIVYDRLSEFYRFLPVIGIKPFGHDNNPPEIPFAFYVKMLQIRNHRLNADPKVMRTEEYLKLKGELGGHELV